MYELFYYPRNASLAPHFVLEEVGAPFKLRLVDRKVNGQKDPEYMKRELSPVRRALVSYAVDRATGAG